MEFKTQSPDKWATSYDRNDSLIYWAVMCTCSALVNVFVDRFSSIEDCVSAIHTRQLFNSQYTTVCSHFILYLYVWLKSRAFSFSKITLFSVRNMWGLMFNAILLSRMQVLFKSNSSVLKSRAQYTKLAFHV